mgnify:CR=1 FL=1
MDKGKDKMSEFKDPDSNESIHTLNSKSKGLDAPIMWTHAVKKAITIANKKLRCSTREENPFGYDDYMVS